MIRSGEERTFFKKNGFLKLQGFLGPELKEIVTLQLKKVKYSTLQYPTGAEEEQLITPLNTVLSTYIENSVFFDSLQHLTGKKVFSFGGRVYRLNQGVGFFWHQDLVEKRTLGISINLSPEKYEGGTFIIRNKNLKTPSNRVPNTVFGDAVLFDIGKKWEHKVTPIRNKPRIAFAGWFSSK